MRRRRQRQRQRQRQRKFTPVRDKNSNLVFIPVSFGDLSGAIFNTADELVATFTEEGTADKGSGKQKSNAECTFAFSEVSDASGDPDDEFFPPEGFTFAGSGTAVVKISGRP